jgi:hypothetical protein
MKFVAINDPQHFDDPKTSETAILETTAVVESAAPGFA